MSVTVPQTAREDTLVVERRSSKERNTIPSPLGLSTRGCLPGCVIPPYWWATLILAGFVLLPVVVFLTSVVPSSEWFSFVIVLTLCLVAFTIQGLAVSCDPGIIPKNPPEVSLPEPKEITLHDGTKMLEKICPTCNIIKPPRSGHCTVCNNCVEDFDHHCGMVGSCVGRRTYRFFTLYFYVLTPLALYIWVRSLIFLIMDVDWDHWSESSHFERWRVVAALGCMLYSCCAGATTFGEAAIYTNWACRGLNAKLDWNAKYGTAYAVEADIGVCSCRRCWNQIFGPVPKSRVHNSPAVDHIV